MAVKIWWSNVGQVESSFRIELFYCRPYRLINSRRPGCSCVSCWTDSLKMQIEYPQDIDFYVQLTITDYFLSYANLCMGIKIHEHRCTVVWVYIFHEKCRQKSQYIRGGPISWDRFNYFLTLVKLKRTFKVEKRQFWHF